MLFWTGPLTTFFIKDFRRKRIPKLTVVSVSNGINGVKFYLKIKKFGNLLMFFKSVG